MGRPDEARVNEAAGALTEGERVPLSEIGDVHEQPGLYAFWAETPEAIRRLGLTDDAAKHPLYVGLARNSLRRRVGEYLDPNFRRYISLRFDLETLLLWGSHTLVREGVLFQYLWTQSAVDHTTLPFARTAGPELSAWMREHVSVSTLTCSTGEEASAVEHPVIAEMLPTTNQNGMRGAHLSESFFTSRFRDTFFRAALPWIDTLDFCWALAGSAIRSSREPVYVTLSEDESIAGVTTTPGPDTSAEPLELPFDPGDRAASRAAALEAMGRWGGSDYPEVDRLLEFMGPNYWVPGIASWMLDTCFEESYAGPLSPLA